MKTISLRRANQADVPQIMDIMTRARAAMLNPEDYITDPEDYVRCHISQKGFVILGEVNDMTAGFFMTVTPESIAENTGYCLDFPPDVLAVTGILDSAAVAPEYQGLGLMGLMATEAIRLLEESCRYLVATVSPTNGPSLHTMKACGFQPYKRIRKPNGQARYLMLRTSQEVPEFTDSESGCI